MAKYYFVVSREMFPAFDKYVKRIVSKFPAKKVFKMAKYYFVVS